MIGISLIGAIVFRHWISNIFSKSWRAFLKWRQLKTIGCESKFSASSIAKSFIGFPDLKQLPPELALNVLSNLNATDLSLAGCVWQQLASDEILWSSLCRRVWAEASVYRKRNPKKLSAKNLYLLLDEGTLIFNSDPVEGMEYFFTHGLVSNNPTDIAGFFHHTTTLSKRGMRLFLESKPEVTQILVTLQNFSQQSLPNALRNFFGKLEAPEDRGNYLLLLLDGFSKRFVQCNPSFGYSSDIVYIMCFSLLLLSVDLSSPHVKNKMSKREFIRNTRNAVPNIRHDDDDVFGEMYDNVFLRGHISCGFSLRQNNQSEFIPGYLALFL